MDLLTYPPILRALAAVLISGATFPISGVLVLEMNLITLRFALMHGALLGGAIAVAASVHPVGPIVAVNAVIVVAIGRIARRSGQNPGLITAMLMTVSIAVAALIVYRFNVPARDTLTLIWGNVYALRPADLVITGALGACLVAAFLAARHDVIAVLFDPEIALTSGVREPVIYYAILAAVSLTVAAAMRLVGALLLDVFVLLPALAARQVARSARGLFVIACATGLVSGLCGFALSVTLDLPLSTGATAPAVLFVLVAGIVRRRRAVRKERSV